ncbi:MAG: D-lyxose ketol-isomerase [Clostridiales bacterium]|jgi:D-lyxose ketol-isomerase|nr:D-lyxose ketol-isomerase [Clostridiales bacterium]
MLTKKEFMQARDRAVQMMRQAGIIITQKEIEEMDVADFGLNDLLVEGGQMLTFFNTSRVSAKVIALFPGQTLPEHWHTALGDDPGKEETIRVVWGILYFCQEGQDTLKMARIPKEKKNCYTARNERVMTPGDQITIEPGIKHWFQAGQEGTVMFSFSSSARDALDPFTDTNIVRVTKIID